MTLELDGVHRVRFSFKYPKVSLLPKTPYDEPQDEFPDFVEDGILEGVIALVFDGVHDDVGETICSFASRGYVGPELFSKRTLIENVFHGFFMDFAKEAL